MQPDMRTDPASGLAMIGVPNLRSFQSNTTNSSKGFHCHPDGESEGTLILTLATMGVVTNTIMMSLILINKHLRRWSQGLLFHQGVVDFGRAAILLPLGFSLLHCEPIYRCSRIETGFLLLVTVSTINMLTIVLNDSPIFPEEENEEEDSMSGPLLMDSPQCVFFGTFIIWFASITINLGPTFLSGGMAARSEMIRHAPSCPLVHGPFRHYILNALWILINVICVILTLFHLHKLYRDLTKANVEAVKVAGLVTTLVNVTGASGPSKAANVTSNTSQRAKKTGSLCSALEEHQRMRNYLLRIEREGIQKVKMFLVITTAYIIFWGPLYFATLAGPKLIMSREGYEITLQIAYIHPFVNPVLFLVLHRGLRHATFRVCCGCFVDCIRNMRQTSTAENGDNQDTDEGDFVVEVPQADLLVPPPPPPVHQSNPTAQFSQTISESLPHHPYNKPNTSRIRTNFNSATDEEAWRIITKPTILKLPLNQNPCRPVSQTLLTLQSNSSSSNVGASCYSSGSE